MEVEEEEEEGRPFSACDRRFSLVVFVYNDQKWGR